MTSAGPGLPRIGGARVFKPKDWWTSRHRIGATRVVVSVLLLVNLFVFAMTVATLRQGRRHAEEAAALSAQNLTQVLESNLRGDIQKIDLALFALKGEMKHQMATGGLRQELLNSYISQLFSQFPDLSSIRTANAEGRIDHGIGVQPGSTLSISDRAYFIEAQRNARAGLMISEPVVGRISGQWVVVLARRVDHLDGVFAGVVYAVIPVEHLTQSMTLINLGPHGTVTLRGGDLGFYAKYPFIEALGNVVGRRDISSTFQALFQQGQTSGVYTARGGLDGVERIYSFKKVGNHPLYIHLGLAVEDYLAKWRSEARRYWIFVGMFTLFTSALAWLLHRAWRRERVRAREEVQELRGLLPICATCKKIRDDSGYWNQIESYVQAHSAAQFTHGVCPECADKLYAEMRESPDSGA